MLADSSLNILRRSFQPFSCSYLSADPKSPRKFKSESGDLSLSVPPNVTWWRAFAPVLSSCWITLIVWLSKGAGFCSRILHPQGAPAHERLRYWSSQFTYAWPTTSCWSDAWSNGITWVLVHSSSKIRQVKFTKFGERPSILDLHSDRILSTNSKSETKRCTKKSDPILRCTTPSTGKRLGEVVIGTLYTYVKYVGTYSVSSLTGFAVADAHPWRKIFWHYHLFSCSV